MTHKEKESKPTDGTVVCDYIDCPHQIGPYTWRHCGKKSDGCERDPN